MTFDIRYDRRVSEQFLGNFLRGGVAHSLVDMARKAAYPIDLQFRMNPKTSAEHATLYTGLTAVLNVVGDKKGHLKLSAHKTWSETRNYGFRAEWLKGATADEWRSQWPAVELYLERVIPSATKSHGLTEGAVQSAVSSHKGKKRVMLDREVTPHFRDARFKENVLKDCRTPILEVLHAEDFEAGKPPAKLGAECDLLALESDGRILAVEVKPWAGGSIAWVPAQALMYARVLQRWIDADGELSRDVLLGMLDQRQRVGLCSKLSVKLPDQLRVTPVVALQRGASETSLARMMRVHRALSKRAELPLVEIYEVSITGQMRRLDG